MAQWDAFISYARSASTLEAQGLQTAIQTFAKPWHRLRAVRIFRDDSSMSANPGLWSTIEQGLREASWLVVLLSPAAARSEYVANEIGWWLRHKDAGHILLVHDEGTLSWDRARNDFSDASDCVPAPLRGAFREEPRWTDLSWFDAPGSSGTADPRFRERVADLASAIRGIPRDELLGDDVAQHKRSWRLARLAIGALSLLLVASVVASIIAIAQRNEVVRQANSLLARQLAATADSLLTRDLRRAQLLAVQAYRTDPNPDARAALLRATLASPALRRFVPFDATISALSASSDGRYVAVGLDNGEVYSWDVATAAPVSRLRLTQAVTDVGISDNGAVLVAADGATTQATTADGSGSLVSPAGQAPRRVAVSPSGASAVVGSANDSTASLTLVDLKARRQRTVADPVNPDLGGSYALRFVGDDTLMLVGSVLETRAMPAFTRIKRADFTLGAHQMPGRPSADGRFSTATNGAAEVPIWRTDRDNDQPARYAFVPQNTPAALALNHDGSRLAVADANGIHLAEVRATDAPAGYGHSATPPTSFVGVTDVNLDGLMFLGNSNRFVAASGAQLSLWDPDSAGRSSDTAELPIIQSCVACGSPGVVLSPDGSSMAIRDGEFSGLRLQSVPGRAGVSPASWDQRQVSVGTLSNPLWLDDGTVLVVASGSSSGLGSGAIPSLPGGVVGWVTDTPDSRPLAVRASADGGSVLVVNAAGRLARYQARTGQLIGEVPAPADDTAAWFDAAIDADLALVALVPTSDRSTVVSVRDATTGAERFTVRTDAETPDRVLFAAGSLWVRYVSGLIERRDPRTGVLQRSLPVRLSGTGPLTEASGVVAIPTDAGVALYDATADALVGTVGFPANWQSIRRGVGLAPDASVVVSAFEPIGDEKQGLAISTQLAPESMVGVACRTSGGSLTADDWATLVGPDAPADLSCR